jgi:hypothetical protein
VIPEGKVAIVSNDAGGAELVSSWLVHNKISHALSLDGPARDIFQRKIGSYQDFGYKGAINQSNWVLTGTGWSSKLELNAIKYALSINKYVVSILDHWVNYQERFLDGSKIYLPDEIWVTDKIALKEAKSSFKNVKIRLINNHYLDDLLSEIGQYEKHYCSEGSTNILYLCEPMRTDWGKKDEQGEFQAMRLFFNNLHKIPRSNEANIFLRLHPSEAYNKYDDFIKNNFPGVKVNKIKDIPLSKQIAQSDIVVGCETYALAIAIQAKKKVFSTLPPWAPECVIPYKKIKHLKEFV